jgi:hypothetical protein
MCYSELYIISIVAAGNNDIRVFIIGVASHHCKGGAGIGHRFRRRSKHLLVLKVLAARSVA